VMLVLGLAACSQVDQTRQWVRTTSAATYDKIGMTGKNIGAPWGGPRSDVPRDQDSLTIARVFGPNPAVDPLRSEGGNVWPQPEPPRATLANPDAALRGIPSYRPPGAPSLSPGGVTGMGITPEPRQRVRGSSSPPPQQPEPASWRQDDRRPMSALPPPGLEDAPPRRADGRALNTPGGVATTGAGNDRVGTYIGPGGASGTMIQGSGGTTLIGPGGQITTVPNPR